MKVKGAGELSGTQKIGLRREGRFSENCWYLVPRTQRNHTFNRHPEEPRACAASRRTLRALVAHPSRLAVKNGEHLRITVMGMTESGLLPILLDAGGAQSGEAMLVDGKLPGQEFVDGERVAAAGFFEGEQAAADRGNDFGLAADHPPFGPGRGQIRNC
jgi:hypothetical protein